MSSIIDISPAIWEKTAVWPGDESFRRKRSQSIDGGDNIDLSAIFTTVHVGAHADAPSHFVRGGDDIASRPLDFYYGPCQVIETRTGRGARIAPGDLADGIRAPRILLRTGTFPDPETFNEDFAALSVELVDYAAGRGVRLIGIDTPSMDLFDDERLIAHQAIGRHGMANLECLVLGHVDPGLYTLLALPLKIPGADASPVRAALVRE